MRKSLLLIILLAAGGANAATLFIKAVDLPRFKETHLPLPEGEYTVWAWTHDHATISVYAGPNFLTSRKPKAPAAKPAYHWRKLGIFNVKPGKNLTTRSDIENGIACLCFSNQSDYDPAAVWALMWTRDTDPSASPDGRAQACRHINQAYKTWTYPTLEAWKARAAHLRNHLLVSSGLLPMPKKTPLNANIFGRINRDKYSIEKVYFESWPGFYVTGNLYRPLGKKGPFPAVLCPHGHWGQGRFTDEGGDRGGVPPRAIELARLGCVVFTYDMVGFGDSKKQMGHSIAGETNELWGTSMMKLQMWNAIRSVDFLETLPDVDRDSIACTGASGGGTQTFMLMAIDPRIKVASPVCMVSAFMQGGCECENAPLLRLDTINSEIAGLMAPRPQLLVSASGDWTSKTPEVEYPMVKSIYTLYGAADKVENAHFKAPHNYNKNSREAVYNFFLKHLLKKPQALPHKEAPYTIEPVKDLSVWAGRELPENALDRSNLAAVLNGMAQKQLKALRLKREDPKFLQILKDQLGTAYRHVVYVDGLEKEGKAKVDGQNFQDLQVNVPGLETVKAKPCLLCLNDQKIPAIAYERSHTQVAIVVHPDGKAGLVDVQGGTPGPLVSTLLKNNTSVIAIDPFLTGEHHSVFEKTVRKKANKMHHTYNRSTLVERVRDIVLTVRYTAKDLKGAAITLIGLENAGKWVALAAPFLPDNVTVVADLKRYNSSIDAMWRGEDFSPLIKAVGAVKTAAALRAPRQLVLFNVNTGFDKAWPLAAYQAAGNPDALTIIRGSLSPEKIADFAGK